MSSKLYKEVENFVKDSFTKIGLGWQIKHFERTVYWVLELKPDSDEALLISAISHDIERAFRKTVSHKDVKKSKKGFSDINYLNFHQKEGGKIIEKFLKKQNANKKLIQRVKMLISKHEIGGNTDQNLLKDADSLSFFENNTEYFIKKLVLTIGTEKIKGKIDWMFNRISSEKAKKIAFPWYKKAIKQLNH